MGRRYYCDYCNKSFIDDLEARRKHLNSVVHLEAFKSHYLEYKDPREILQEEMIKKPCNKFVQGLCIYGANCRFSHYSKIELHELMQLAEEREYEEKQKLHIKENEIPSIDSWVQKRSNKILSENENNVFWSYPEYLETRLDLPPSLKKLKPECFTDVDFAEWG